MMRALAFLFCLLVSFTALADSTINTTLPVQNVPYNAAPIRQNFGAAAADINALQNMNLGVDPPSAPVYGTLWLQQPETGTTYTLNMWIASANTWAPIARVEGSTGYWVPPVGGGTLPSLTSAATTDLGSVPNAALYVTGSQSIGSFGSSAPPGQLKFVIFTAAATLIYNSTYMILPGSVNFTAGPSSTAIMLSLGQGKWRMLNLAGGTGPTSCDIFTDVTSGCVPASGGGVVNFLRADGTWVPAGGNTEFTIAAGFTNTIGTLNIGDQTIANSSTLSEQFWVNPKSGPYTVNADNGGTSDTGVFLISTAGGVVFSAPNPSLATKGITYQFGSDGTNGFTLTTVGGTATFYGCPGPGTGSALYAFGAVDVQITDDGVNYKCTSSAPVTTAAILCADITDAGTVCPENTGTSGHTIPFLDGSNTWSDSNTFTEVEGTVRTVAGTTDLLSQTDCGKTVVYTSGSAVSVTTFAGAASGTKGCGIALQQQGAGAVSIVNGAGATNVSPHACTQTFGQYATMGLFVQPNNPSQWNLFGDCIP